MTRLVLPANDPQWSNDDFRTAQLRGLMALHGLSGKDIARLTNKDYGLVKHWMSGKYRQITTDTLRALQYELLVEKGVK